MFTYGYDCDTGLFSVTDAHGIAGEGMSPSAARLDYYRRTMGR